MKQVTLEALIERKQKAQLCTMQTKEVEIPLLNMKVTVVKQPLTRVLRVMDDYKDLTKLSSQYELYKEIIYMSVPLFQNEELHSAYECAEPMDVISRVLEDNIDAISSLGEAIISMYGIGDNKAVQDLKN